jgi:hypothetical protein
MKAILSALFVLFTFSLFSQGSLNQFDNNGKKHGAWVVFLDKNWHLAKDSMSAVYFRYNYFNHGNSCHPMGPGGLNKDKLEIKTSTSVKKGNAVMLDGVYKWYNSKGVLKFEHVLKDGWYVSYKEYYSNGQVESFFDYTQHYTERDKTQEHSYSITTYNKKGKQTFNGWASENQGGKGVDN